MAENERTIRPECAGQMFAFWALRKRFESELEAAGFPEDQRSAVGACLARAVRKYAEDRGFFERGNG